MPFIERALRVMTHFNIGATLATGLWLLWSGWTVVMTPPVPTAIQHTAPRQTMQPLRASPVESSCECFLPAPLALSAQASADHLVALAGSVSVKARP